MRILEVAPAWFPVPPERYGGIELMVAGLADGLVGAGHDVTLAAAAGSTSRARLRMLPRPLPSERLGDAFVELPHIMHAYEASADVDVVHDHTTMGAALGAMTTGAPVVHTVHGQWTDETVRVCRAMGDRVELVALSADQASRAPSDIRISRVIHNGVPFARYRFQAEADPDRHLSFLGRAGHDKGADAAVAVAARLRRPLRMAVKVNEPDEHLWWDHVLAPMLADTDVDVELIRNATHAEKLDVIAGSAALLCPLRWDEPFGLMMVEANACGTPVVAWARGAAAEVVDHGTTGLLADPDDLDQLCEATSEVDSFDRGIVRSRAREQFGVETMVRRYERFLSQVAADARQRGPRVDHEDRIVDLATALNRS